MLGKVFGTMLEAKCHRKVEDELKKSDNQGNTIEGLKIRPCGVQGLPRHTVL